MRWQEERDLLVKDLRIMVGGLFTASGVSIPAEVVRLVDRMSVCHSQDEYRRFTTFMSQCMRENWTKIASFEVQ